MVIATSGRGVGAVVGCDAAMSTVHPVRGPGRLVMVTVLVSVVMMVAVEEVRVNVVVLAVLFRGWEFGVYDDALVVQPRLMVVRGPRVHKEGTHSAVRDSHSPTYRGRPLTRGYTLSRVNLVFTRILTSAHSIPVSRIEISLGEKRSPHRLTTTEHCFSIGLTATLARVGVTADVVGVWPGGAGHASSSARPITGLAMMDR